MTEKRLFVGRKKCEDRFTIINDYDGEIGVKENRSGDVLVLKHSDLNAQQFVAQLVVFLNDQNQAIVDLYDGSKYWSDKATEKIKELQKENEQLKKEKEIVKEKLLNYILDYKKISNDNWNMGLSGSVETLQNEVKSLFEDPFEWKYEYDCDNCKCFRSIKDNYDEAICSRYDKKISYYDTACKKFEWK